MAVASKGVPNKVFHRLEEAIKWLSTEKKAGSRLAGAPNDAIHALQVYWFSVNRTLGLSL
jgi:hypothetical protein